MSVWWETPVKTSIESIPFLEANGMSVFNESPTISVLEGLNSGTLVQTIFCIWM